MYSTYVVDRAVQLCLELLQVKMKPSKASTHPDRDFLVPVSLPSSESEKMDIISGFFASKLNCCSKRFVSFKYLKTFLVDLSRNPVGLQNIELEC